MSADDLSFDITEFLHVPAPTLAVVKSDFKIAFKTNDGKEGSLGFFCCETIQYESRETDIMVYYGPSTLQFSAEEFDSHFRKVNLAKIAPGYRYLTFMEFELDVEPGATYRIHDFESDLIVQVAISESSGSPRALLVLGAAPLQDGKPGYLANKNMSYDLQTYGKTWAALTEE